MTHILICLTQVKIQSKWDVSSVTSMDQMFYRAAAFTQQLFGVVWVHSKASKNLIFEGSPVSISATVPAFSPQSRAALKSAVDAYLEYSSTGDGSDGPHGLIGEWNVSRVIDMNGIFANVRTIVIWRHLKVGCVTCH